MKAAAFVVLIAACRSTPPSPAALVDLSSSLDAFRTEFDAHAHEAHFLTLLSPT